MRKSECERQREREKEKEGRKQKIRLRIASGTFKVIEKRKCYEINAERLEAEQQNRKRLKNYATNGRENK